MNGNGQKWERKNKSSSADVVWACEHTHTHWYTHADTHTLIQTHTHTQRKCMIHSSAERVVWFIRIPAVAVTLKQPLLQYEWPECWFRGRGEKKKTHRHLWTPSPEAQSALQQLAHPPWTDSLCPSWQLAEVTHHNRRMYNLIINPKLCKTHSKTSLPWLLVASALFLSWCVSVGLYSEWYYTFEISIFSNWCYFVALIRCNLIHSKSASQFKCLCTVFSVFLSSNLFLFLHCFPLIVWFLCVFFVDILRANEGF